MHAQMTDAFKLGVLLFLNVSVCTVLSITLAPTTGCCCACAPAPLNRSPRSGSTPWHHPIATARCMAEICSLYMCDRSLKRHLFVARARTAHIHQLFFSSSRRRRPEQARCACFQSTSTHYITVRTSTSSPTPNWQSTTTRTRVTKPFRIVLQCVMTRMRYPFVMKVNVACVA